MRRILIVCLTAACAIALIALPTSMSEPWRWVAPPWMYAATIITANIAALTACGLSLILVAKRSRDDATFALALFLSFAALAYGCYSAGTYVDAFQSIWLRRALNMLEFSAVVAAGAGCMRFAALFPSPITRDDIERMIGMSVRGERIELRDSWGAVENRVDRWIQPMRDRYKALTLGRSQTIESMAGIIRFHAWLLQPRTAWTITAYSTAAICLMCAIGLPKVAFVVAAYMSSLCGILAVVYLRWRYATGDDTDRRRALWVVEGFLLALLPGMLVELVLFPLVLINLPVTELFLGAYVLSLAVGAVAFVACLAVATFYTGSFDTGLVIRRTTIYSGVVVVLTGAFAIIENLVTNVIAAHTSLPANTGAAVAAVGVAIAFGPVRDWITRAIEKRKR